MKRVTRNHLMYRFDQSLPPALEIDPGEEVILETLDALSGDIKKPEDMLTLERSSEHVNPTTGPICVRGAEPGDTLMVDILEIQLASQGWISTFPEGGVLADEMEPLTALTPRVEGDEVIWSDRIRFPIRPMVGTIATTPPGPPVTTHSPAHYGGNMDHPDIRPGARVYLPVLVPGALFSLGDVHACQGDAEVTCSAIEIAADVRIRIDLLRGRCWPRPWIEFDDTWITCANAPTVEEGIRIATRDMVELLVEKLEVSREEAFMLISATGDLRLGEAPRLPGLDVSVRAVMPKLGAEQGNRRPNR